MDEEHRAGPAVSSTPVASLDPHELSPAVYGGDEALDINDLLASFESPKDLGYARFVGTEEVPRRLADQLIAAQSCAFELSDDRWAYLKKPPFEVQQGHLYRRAADESARDLNRVTFGHDGHSSTVLRLATA
jgi:hypothetical protein